MSLRTFMTILAGEFLWLLWLAGEDPTLRVMSLSAAAMLIAVYGFGMRAASNAGELDHLLMVTTEALERQLAHEAGMTTRRDSSTSPAAYASISTQQPQPLS